MGVKFTLDLYICYANFILKLQHGIAVRKLHNIVKFKSLRMCDAYTDTKVLFHGNIQFSFQSSLGRIIDWSDYYVSYRLPGPFPPPPPPPHILTHSTSGGETYCISSCLSVCLSLSLSVTNRVWSITLNRSRYFNAIWYKCKAISDDVQ